jgi:Holliday junction resolvase RusA-like endonuclease
MKKVYTIYLKPISVNQAYSFTNKKMYMNKDAKEFKNKINELVKDEKKIYGKVKLYVEFGFKDKRKRDVDNYLKLFIDSIKNILIEDDSEIITIVSKKIISKEYYIRFFIKSL